MSTTLVSALQPHTFWRTAVAWRALGIAPTDSVLDAGCGGGYLAERAATVGNRVVAIDHSQAVITHNRRRAEHRPALEFRHGDIHNLDAILKGERFSKVACLDVLEHVHDARPILAALARAVGLGGTLCLTIPLDPGHGHCELNAADVDAELVRGGLEIATNHCIRPPLPASLVITAFTRARGLVAPPSDVDDWSETRAFRLAGDTPPWWLRVYRGVVWPMMRSLILLRPSLHRAGGDLLLVIARRPGDAPTASEG